MKTNKLEYKGEKFIISFNPEENLILLKEWGGLDEKKAIKIREKISEFSKKIPPDKTMRLLVEVPEYTKTTAESRKVFLPLVKAMMKRRAKIAIVTPSPTVRVVARFIGFGIKGINSFATREKAVKWLKSKK